MQNMQIMQNIQNMLYMQAYKGTKTQRKARLHRTVALVGRVEDNKSEVSGSIPNKGILKCPCGVVMHCQCWHKHEGVLVFDV